MNVNLDERLGEAKRLFTKGQYAHAQRIVLEIIQRDQKNQEAIELFERIRNIQSKTSWLPRKNWRERFFNRALLKFLILGLVVALSLYAFEQLPIELAALRISLSALFNAGLGWLISKWWDEIDAEDRNLQDARRISVLVEDEMQKASSDLEETIRSLRLLSQKPDAVVLSKYFMGKHISYVKHSIHNWANEIHGLGYNNQLFLDEKYKQFSDIQSATERLVKELRAKESDSFLSSVIDGAFETSLNLLPSIETDSSKRG